MKKKESKYVVYHHCSRFSAKDNNLKGGLKMVKKKEEIKSEKPIKVKSDIKVKKISLSSQIKDLLGKGKSVEEVMKELNCKRKSVLDTRWLMQNKNK